MSCTLLVCNKTKSWINPAKPLMMKLLRKNILNIKSLIMEKNWIVTQKRLLRLWATLVMWATYKLIYNNNLKKLKTNWNSLRPNLTDHLQISTYVLVIILSNNIFQMFFIIFKLYLFSQNHNYILSFSTLSFQWLIFNYVIIWKIIYIL